MIIHVWVAVTALALSANTPAVEGGRKSDDLCFKCTQTFDGSYQGYYHEDWIFGSARVDGVFVGNMHSMDWSTCLNAISVAGHVSYGGGDPEDLVVAVQEAVSDGNVHALIGLIIADAGVELNSSRRAIQVVDVPQNRVVFQVRLSSSQYARVAKRLSDRGVGG